MEFHTTTNGWIILEMKNKNSNIPIVEADFKNTELLQSFEIYKKIEVNTNAPLEWLPDTIEYICYNDIYVIDKVLGEITIRNIRSEEYNYKEDKYLQAQIVKYQKLIYKAEAPLDWLPYGLKILSIQSQSFDHPLDNLPSSLVSLEITTDKLQLFKRESYFNQPLYNLPIGLKCLILGGIWAYNFELNSLPSTLEYVSLLISYPYKLTSGQKENMQYLIDTISNIDIYLIANICNAFNIEKFNYVSNNFSIPKEYLI